MRVSGRENLERAGKSLRKDSAVSAMSEASTAAGSLFERRFARFALEGRRLPWWSMHNDHLWTSRDGNPQGKRGSKGGRYTSDVDFIFANGNNVIFVDVKGYSAGKFYWNTWFTGDYRIREGLSGFKKDKKTDEIQSLSRSMDMATNQYRELLPDANIKSIILFVPVGKISPADYSRPADQRKLPGSVTFLRAAGGIKSYKIEEGFREINKHIGREEMPVPIEIQTVFDQHAIH